MIRAPSGPLIAALLALALSACGSAAPLRPPLARDIGPPPPYLQPVEVARPRENEPAEIIIRRVGGGLNLANCIIRADRQEWKRTRAQMLTGEEPKRAAPPDCKAKPADRAKKRKR